MTSYIPSLWVSIGGAGGLLSNPRELCEVRIQQRLGLPALCVLGFEGVPEAASAITIGCSLEVSIHSADEALFRGEITAVEYIYPAGRAPCLRVRGYDPLHRLRKRQHVRAYCDCGLQHLLRELAGNDAQLVGDDLSWPLLIQHQQTDLEFLAEQAALAGRYPLAREGKIFLIPLSGLSGQVDVPLVYGQNLFEARIEANADGDCDSVSVYGWETAKSDTTSVQGNTADTGQRVDLRVDVRDVGGMPERALVNQGLENEQHARALARAELERRKAGDILLWGRTEGNPALQPGVPVWVSGVSDAVTGRYILTTATHTYDYVHGYTVEFSNEPPPAPQRSRCDVSTLGLVTDVDDPQRMGRVRARLPGYCDIETGWMPVVCPGAGRGKGFISLPDPGDRVLVILAREDPAHGIVLGGLYAPEKTPDDCVSAGQANRYTWTTQDGQRIRLEQDGNLVLIENGAGAGIELKGNEIVIKAGRIDFRRS